MTTLYSFGMDPTRWYSRAKFAYTVDDVAWTPGGDPTGGLGSITTMARGGSTWVGASNFGQITVSNNLSNWYAYDPEHKTWLINQIGWGGNRFVAVGHEKNPTSLQETGFVAVSTNGGPATWVRKYVSYSENMCLFGVKHIGLGKWIAVGGSNNLSSPVVLYSTDNGETWTRPLLPGVLTGAIYSVEVNGLIPTEVWLGGKGWVAYSSNFQESDTSWNLIDTLSDQGESRPVTNLFYRNTQGLETAVALTGSTAYFSGDNIVWQSHSEPGYRFMAANSLYNPALQTSTLHLSAGGLLNQYTGFKTTWAPGGTDELRFVGYNNGVQASTLLTV
jgi:hypothetical protein